MTSRLMAILKGRRLVAERLAGSLLVCPVSPRLLHLPDQTHVMNIWGNCRLNHLAAVRRTTSDCSNYFVECAT